VAELIQRSWGTRALFFTRRQFVNFITPDESSRMGESGIGTIEGIVGRVKRTNE